MKARFVDDIPGSGQVEKADFIKGSQGNLSRFTKDNTAPRGAVAQALLRAWCEIDEDVRREALGKIWR